MGFSPDGRTIAVVSIGSNSVSFIDTATNAVKHTTYIGRSPHEAFFTPDGREVWVTVRGEDYVSVLDAQTLCGDREGQDAGRTGHDDLLAGRPLRLCLLVVQPGDSSCSTSRRTPSVGRVQQPSPFCPNIAATPDGTQVWFTLKDTGKTQVFDAKPPFATLKTLDTGPITNHVNFVRQRARAVCLRDGRRPEPGARCSARDDFAKVATIPVGKLPHGIWPSGDGSRVYVGLENDDAMVAIDTAVEHGDRRRCRSGRRPQARRPTSRTPCRRATVCRAWMPLGVAAGETHLTLGARGPDGHAGDQRHACSTRALVQIARRPR